MKFKIFKKTYWALILFAFFACSDDEEPPVCNSQLESCEVVGISFNGISPTDANGAATGNQTPDDWMSITNPNDCEVEIFGNSVPFCTGSEAMVFPAFPNPAGSEFGLAFQLEEVADLQLTLVDDRYKVQRVVDISKDQLVVGSNITYFRLDDLSLPLDTFRLYYKFDFTDCDFIGYGDIFVQN